MHQVSSVHQGVGFPRPRPPRISTLRLGQRRQRFRLSDPEDCLDRNGARRNGGLSPTWTTVAVQAASQSTALLPGGFANGQNAHVGRDGSGRLPSPPLQRPGAWHANLGDSACCWLGSLTKHGGGDSGSSQARMLRQLVDLAAYNNCCSEVVVGMGASYDTFCPLMEVAQSLRR